MYDLNPVPLLNPFISSNRFLVNSLEFSAYNIMLSTDRNVYIFLNNFDAFYFFACAQLSWLEPLVQCWIEVARVNIVLFPILGENIQSFTIKLDVSCGFFIVVPI